MASEPCNHHHIPQGYLRGFGWKGKKYWYTNVAALQSQNWFETNIRNVGAERDFLRIDIEGHSPLAVENAMGEFEAKSAAAIQSISKTHRFEGDDRVTILNLIALLCVSPAAA